jgi:hypothetical protein
VLIAFEGWRAVCNPARSGSVISRAREYLDDVVIDLFEHVIPEAKSVQRPMIVEIEIQVQYSAEAADAAAQVA